jgi:hypothetical protein
LRLVRQGIQPGEVKLRCSLTSRSSNSLPLHGEIQEYLDHLLGVSVEVLLCVGQEVSFHWERSRLSLYPHGTWIIASGCL